MIKSTRKIYRKSTKAKRAKKTRRTRRQRLKGGWCVTNKCHQKEYEKRQARMALLNRQFKTLTIANVDPMINGPKEFNTDLAAQLRRDLGLPSPSPKQLYGDDDEQGFGFPPESEA